MNKGLLAGLIMMVTPAANAQVAETAMDDPVLRTLEEGDAAIASQDYVALFEAAQTLQALGAAPVEGQDDIAAQWILEARARGVTRTALGFRGRALGPAYRRGLLSAGDSITMQQLFLAGQRARISLASRATPPGTLSLRVRGSDGKMLCEQPVSSVQADCNWLPIFTGRFDIVIQNGGTQPANFYLTVR